MKTEAILIALCIIATTDACVTYNPGKGTYTVDSSGCVRTFVRR